MKFDPLILHIIKKNTEYKLSCSNDHSTLYAHFLKLTNISLDLLYVHNTGEPLKETLSIQKFKEIVYSSTNKLILIVIANFPQLVKKKYLIVCSLTTPKRFNRF